MELGTQTGSLINHLYSRSVVGQPEVKVGMAATILLWTDRKPGTVFRVIKVGKATIIEVREDKYSRTDSNGMSESQEYTYSTDVQGPRNYFRMEVDGSWTNVRKNEKSGRWVKTKGRGLIIGHREKYHDFSF